jgi:hypothetical protein
LERKESKQQIVDGTMVRRKREGPIYVRHGQPQAEAAGHHRRLEQFLPFKGSFQGIQLEMFPACDRIGVIDEKCFLSYLALLGFKITPSNYCLPNASSSEVFILLPTSLASGMYSRHSFQKKDITSFPDYLELHLRHLKG